MLKTRIIPTLLYKHHGLVKGVGFDSWRRVGPALPAVKVYKEREVDELILLDIAATPEGVPPDCEEIDFIADECLMPLTVGGGVKSCGHFSSLLQAGADKVAVNTGALEQPGLINEACSCFGSQCFVLAIDCRRKADGAYEVFSHCGVAPTGRNPVDWAKEAADRGAGEILLTSIERDGTMQGYDTVLTASIASTVDIPVIASGGAGCYEDMWRTINYGKADAVAAASVFHFTEQTPLEAKRYLAKKGVKVRI